LGIKQRRSNLGSSELVGVGTEVRLIGLWNRNLNSLFDMWGGELKERGVFGIRFW